MESTMERYGQVGLPLAERLALAFDKNIDCDVEFHFPGTAQDMSAHKLILKVGSPVFEAMFSEHFDQKMGIDIKDIEPDIFRQIVRYLYTDEADLDPDTAFPLLYGATKYMVDGLAQECSTFITRNLNEKNVCTFLGWSIKLGEDKLTKSCTELLSNSAENVIHAGYLSDITEQALLVLLKIDKMAVSESDLYKACLKWASSKIEGPVSDKKIRKKLGESLYQIRFHQIQAQELSVLFDENDVLTDKEKNHFLSYGLNMTEAKKQSLESFGFNMAHRAKASIPIMGTALDSPGFPDASNSSWYCSESHNIPGSSGRTSNKYNKIQHNNVCMHCGERNQTQNGSNGKRSGRRARNQSRPRSSGADWICMHCGGSNEY